MSELDFCNKEYTNLDVCNISCGNGVISEVDSNLKQITVRFLYYGRIVFNKHGFNEHYGQLLVGKLSDYMLDVKSKPLPDINKIYPQLFRCKSDGEVISFDSLTSGVRLEASSLYRIGSITKGLLPHTDKTCWEPVEYTVKEV